MEDKLMKIGNTLIQHGKLSDRIYLMHLDKKDMPIVLVEIDKLALENNYSKIFAKVPNWALDMFEKNRFTTEACIPCMVNGNIDVYFMGKYFDVKRKEDENYKKIQHIINTAKSKRIDNKTSNCNLDIKENCKIQILNKENAKDISLIYRDVFDTYPFPIFDYKYIEKTMDTHFIYFGAFINNKLIAVSSCEIDYDDKNVEMTDFATLPKYRGNGFALDLLNEMEKEMKKRGIMTAFTIARAYSFGMNITFSKNCYKYAGTLINNTNISGAIESMNVWYKKL